MKDPRQARTPLARRVTAVAATLLALSVVALVLVAVHQSEAIRAQSDLYAAIHLLDAPGVDAALRNGADPNLVPLAGTPTTPFRGLVARVLRACGLAWSGRDPATRPPLSELLWTVPVAENGVRGRGARAGAATGSRRTESGASEERALVIARSLLGRGADPNCCRGTGNSPLFIAAGSGADSLVSLLLQRGADPNVPALNGITPLMEASVLGRAGAVRILLRGGAQVNTVNAETDSSALCLAVGAGREQVVEALLNAGADPDGPCGGRPVRAAARSIPGMSRLVARIAPVRPGGPQLPLARPPGITGSPRRGRRLETIRGGKGGAGP
jgi:hypothetical protein